MKKSEIKSIFECLDIAQEAGGDIQLAKRIMALKFGFKPDDVNTVASTEDGDSESEDMGGVDPMTERQKEAFDILKKLKENDGDCTVEGFADAMGVTEHNASLLLAAIFAKGHATREKDGRTWLYAPKD